MIDTDDLARYFSIDDIKLIKKQTNDILKNELDGKGFSFQQVIQENNTIKFELGYIEEHFLTDITFRNHEIIKTVINLNCILAFSTREMENYFHVDLYYGKDSFAWYGASSAKKIEQLKKFAGHIEKQFRG